MESAASIQARLDSLLAAHAKLEEDIAGAAANVTSEQEAQASAVIADLLADRSPSVSTALAAAIARHTSLSRALPLLAESIATTREELRAATKVEIEAEAYAPRFHIGFEECLTKAVIHAACAHYRALTGDEDVPAWLIARSGSKSLQSPAFRGYNEHLSRLEQRREVVDAHVDLDSISIPMTSAHIAMAGRAILAFLNQHVAAPESPQ